MLLADKSMAPAPVFTRLLAWGVGHVVPGPFPRLPETSRSTAALPSATLKVVLLTEPEPKVNPGPSMTEVLAPPFAVTVPANRKE